MAMIGTQCFGFVPVDPGGVGGIRLGRDAMDPVNRLDFIGSPVTARFAVNRYDIAGNTGKVKARSAGETVGCEHTLQPMSCPLAALIC